MLKALQFVICLNLLCLVLMMPADLAQAGDEDLTSSAYLVFDPETGEFVTVQDSDRSKQDHAARDPADVASAHSPSSGDSDIQSLPLAAGSAIAIAILGVLIWVQRKKRQLF